MDSRRGDQQVALPAVCSGQLVGFERPAVVQVQRMPRVTIDRQVTESAPLGLVLRQPFMQCITRLEEIRAIYHQRTPGRPDGGGGVLGDELLDGFQIALIGHGISGRRQVLRIGGPHRVEVQHHESIESALLCHLLYAGDGGVEFFLGGSAGVEADDQQRAGSGAAQRVAPLVVLFGVVDVVHGDFQGGIRRVCPVRSGLGIRLFCTTYAGA